MTTSTEQAIDTQSADDFSPANTEPQYTDYFGFKATKKFYFPDGRTYVEFDVMNEGAKARFQKLTSRDLRVQRTTGDALLKMDPGAERHALITESVTGWNLMRKSPKDESRWEHAPFDPSNLRRLLDSTDPSIVEDLEKEIRKANPWLMDEMSVEDIDKEIANLQELRQVAVEREAGKSGSAA
ncbi:hypothetical protein AB0F25_30525 [Streptomyces wedmorensis]|uniref:hypothetical protein n=1 Tax=Streptomyces wedmorensis TaxID=43759 RepID=UPI0034179B5D